MSDLDERKDCYAELGGLRLHYLDFGPTDGEPVILLHGFPEAAYAWRRHWAPIADAGYRVIVPDQRGFNLSDKTAPYDLNTVTSDALQLIDSCRFDTVNVIGHDWGAMVAWSLAALHPGRVRRLVAVNVPHPAVMLGIVQNLDLRQWFRSWYVLAFLVPSVAESILKFSNYWALATILTANARKGTFDKADIDNYRLVWGQPGGLSAMLGWYRALPKLVFDQAERKRFEVKVTVPTLVCWGNRDVALCPHLADKSMEWVTNGRLVRFETGGHWLVEECAPEVTQHILEHLRANLNA